MTEPVGITIFVAVVVCVFTTFFSYGLGRDHGFLDGREFSRKEAIRKGVARWVPDDSGKPEFHWIMDDDL